MALTPLGVESEMTKRAICPPGDTVAVKMDRKEQNNKSNWEKGLRRGRGGSVLGAHFQGVEAAPPCETPVLLR